MDSAPQVSDELLDELLGQFGEEIFEHLIENNINFDDLNIGGGGELEDACLLELNNAPVVDVDIGHLNECERRLNNGK